MRRLALAILVGGCDFYFAPAPHEVFDASIHADATAADGLRVIDARGVDAWISPDAAAWLDAPTDATVDAAQLDAPAPPDASPPDAAPDAAPPRCDLFGDRVDIPTGRNPIFVQTADFNMDGEPDIAIVDFSSDQVSVHLNTTTTFATTPTFAQRVDFALGSVTQSAAVGDFNGDGKPDLVAASEWSDTVTILTNITDANADVVDFATTRFPLGEFPSVVAVADLDRDGKPDLAVIAENPATGYEAVFALLNTTPPGATTPTFGDPSVFATRALCPTSISIGDVNGDGIPDLVVPTRCRAPGDLGDSVSIFIGTSAPGASSATFRSPVTFLTPDYPYSVAIVDLNDDWRPDLAVANFSGDSTSVLFDQTGFESSAPDFTASTDVDTGSEPVQVVAADVDLDGRPDLVTVFGGDGSNAEVSIARNVTPTNAVTPVFERCLQFDEYLAVSVAVVDLNGDGKPDLAVANGGVDTFSVYLAR